MRFAVLITCFNRVEKTLNCLRHLYAARLMYDCKFDVWLNDDGCTDGTSEKVSKDFSAVNIIKGSGHDYWCGGMRRAWKAASECFDYDGYLWLNDDTVLRDDAFEIILTQRCKEDILVGAVCDGNGKATYGGETEKGFVVPDGTWQKLRQMNGNIVWVPKAVFKKLGNFDIHWTHAYGDGDYSRTASEKGIGVYLTPAFVGTCDKNEHVVDWRNPSMPLIKRLKSLYSPLGYAEPAKMFRYCLKHDGLLHAIKLVLSNHITALWPR